MSMSDAYSNIVPRHGDNSSTPAVIPVAEAWQAAKDAGYYPVPFHQIGVHGNGSPKYNFPPGATGGGHDLQYVSPRPGDTFTGFRPPRDVIALDVDHHDAKRGMETLAKYQADNGLPDLPPTFRITSRGKDDAGKMLYQVNGDAGTDLHFRNNLCADVEVITSRHMFVGGVPGTVHHKTGWINACFGPDGEECELPDAWELPFLPDAWVTTMLTTEPAVLADAGAGVPVPQDDGQDCPSARSWLNGWQRTELTAGGWAEVSKKGADFTGGTVRGTREWFATVHLKTLAIHGHHVGKVIAEACAGSAELRDTVEQRWHAAKGHAKDDATCCKNQVTLTEFLPVEVPESDVAPIAPDSSLNLPEAFWNSSGALTAVRGYAHDYGESADAVLYSILARIAAYAPLGMTLDTGIKRPVALNLFAALCGYPGDGKSSANRHASYCAWAQSATVADYPFGSGEGLAEVYMGIVERDLGEKNSKGEVKLTKLRCQTSHNAFFYADEGKAMVDLMFSRAGSTLDSTLRSAFFGEMLGQANGRAENTRRVENYALGAVVGFQPGSIAPLIRETELGTAQRFAYAMATDPSIPADYERKALPPDIAYPTRKLYDYDDNDPPEDAPRWNVPGNVTLTVTAEITRQYKAHHDGVRKGTVRREPGTEHDLLLKGKLAALLLILEGGGTQVTGRQWEAAGMMLDTSHDVRVYMRGLADGIERERRIRAGALAGIEDVARAANAEVFKRATARVIELGGQGHGAREVWQKLSKPQRAAYPSVAAVRQYLEECAG